jgi:hypothetical protein
VIRFSALFCCVFRPCNHFHPSLWPHIHAMRFSVFMSTLASPIAKSALQTCVLTGFVLLSPRPATLQRGRSLIPRSIQCTSAVGPSLSHGFCSLLPNPSYTPHNIRRGGKYFSLRLSSLLLRIFGTSGTKPIEQFTIY